MASWRPSTATSRPPSARPKATEPNETSKPSSTPSQVTRPNSYVLHLHLGFRTVDNRQSRVVCIDLLKEYLFRVSVVTSHIVSFLHPVPIYPHRRRPTIQPKCVISVRPVSHRAILGSRIWVVDSLRMVGNA